MHVCMNVWMYVCMYGNIYACMYECMYVSVYVWKYVCITHYLRPQTHAAPHQQHPRNQAQPIYTCIYIYSHIYTYVCIYCTHILMHACMYGNVYVWKYVCITHYLRTQTRAARYPQHPQNQAPATKTKAVVVIRSWLVCSHPKFPAPRYIYVHIYIHTYVHTNQGMYI